MRDEIARKRNKPQKRKPEEKRKNVQKPRAQNPDANIHSPLARANIA